MLRIFYLKSTELRHETVANLIVVMNHVVTYFGPETLSIQEEALHPLQNGENP